MKSKLLGPLLIVLAIALAVLWALFGLPEAPETVHPPAEVGRAEPPAPPAAVPPPAAPEPATPAPPGQPALSLPLDCQPGVDCWIANYVDLDPEPEVRDYACGRLAYDGHKGTDFAIRDFAEMKRGVPVVAAAPGRVLGVRDSMPDADVSVRGTHTVAGQECGNGVAVDVGAGWVTQYCHMRLGSVRVQPGERVEVGQQLGFVGMSGLTEFPHVHLQVMYQDKVVDPFAGVGRTAYCGLGPHPLWRRDLMDDLGYRPAALFNVGIADTAPQAAAVRDGQHRQERIDPAAAAMVLWVDMFGVQAGDDLHFVIRGPDGRPILDSHDAIDRTQARRFQFNGLKRKATAWPSGEYRGTVTLTREGDKAGPGRYVAETTVRVP